LNLKLPKQFSALGQFWQHCKKLEKISVWQQRKKIVINEEKKVNLVTWQKKYGELIIDATLPNLSRFVMKGKKQTIWRR